MFVAFITCYVSKLFYSDDIATVLNNVQLLVV